MDRNLLASMATTTMPTDDPGFRTTTCDTRENTDGDHFFCLPIAGDLSTVLHQAALQLSGGSRLVQLYPRPIVTSISPTTGSAAGGKTVTVNGKYFTEAYSVTFDGTKGTIVDVTDTLIHVKAPAGTLNATVDIQVSTPGGTSAKVAGDQYRPTTCRDGGRERSRH